VADPQISPPFLRVVRGNPTPEELAAVTVVLAAKARAAAAAGQATKTSGSSEWAARSRLMRASVSPGPGGWKRSAFPR
jgi:hypothetical protein